jgi:hypothetical protein
MEARHDLSLEDIVTDRVWVARSSAIESSLVRLEIRNIARAMSKERDSTLCTI